MGGLPTEEAAAYLASLAERGVTRFRKRPVVVDAYEFHNRIGTDTRPRWIVEAAEAGMVRFTQPRDAPGYLTIKTLEGDMRANPGDWIVRGVAGEIYPVKPLIFAETYEPVS